MTLSGIDPRTITNRVQVEPEATIGTIRAEQEKARKNLEIRLKAMYAREAIRLERELRQTSAAEISQLDLGILSEVSEAVQQLGRERSFPLSRLAFVAGFPDKNPQSIIRKVDKNWIEEKQTADAIRYREELAQADKRFAEKLSAIQGRLSASKKQKLDTVARQIALFREELEKRASREAQSEVQNTLDELGIQLATSEPWNLEKVGSQRQEVSFGASRPGSEVPLTSVSRGASVASDLRLFLKVHRYVLGVKGRSQDATKEFLEWQKEMRRGR